MNPMKALNSNKIPQEGPSGDIAGISAGRLKSVLSK